MKTYRLLLLLFFLGLSFGCANTKITSTWKTPDQAGTSFRNIMVVGIIREKDRSLRARMEKHLMDDLRSQGYNAFSCLERYGPDRFRGLSEADAVRVLKGDSVDAVLTIVMLDKQKERYYVPAQITYSPYSRYQSRMWLYYGVLYDRIETPGYYTESTRYFWESNFYDLNANRLLYSVQTESFDPPSVDKLAHVYGQKIVASLLGSGLLTHSGSTASTF